jgi:16S rRNA (cytosine1402-N4)-methyltransferase
VRAFTHKSVLVSEVMEGLSPTSGGLYVDGTVGGGGHARMILERSAPDGRLVGLDRDEEALAAAQLRLESFAGRFELHRANYVQMREFVENESCSGVLLDLGVSSPQLDWGERGFSFQLEGPLDMRMDRRDPITAADIINTWPEEELANLFWELGEERNSRPLARVIVTHRAARKFETTAQLASILAANTRGPRQKIHPATRVFQALRMEVNRELDALEAGLQEAWLALKAGGRLAVITFHSLEDRLVKDFGRQLERDYTFEGEVDVPELRQPKAPEARWLEKKPITATDEELQANPRARSAKLRVLEKLK